MTRAFGLLYSVARVGAVYAYAYVYVYGPRRTGHGHAYAYGDLALRLRALWLPSLPNRLGRPTQNASIYAHRQARR